MRKQEFLRKLKEQLWALPVDDAQRSVDYYAEMIDDRMDDGLSEEEAVAAVGDLDEIVKQILTETPRPPVVVEPAKKQRRVEPWMVVLLILGSPLWIPLVASVVSVLLGAYVTMWSVVIALYALSIGSGAVTLGCMIGSFFMLRGTGGVVIALGTALLCAGLAILLFLLGNLAAKGMIALTKLAWQGIKNIFAGKERKV